MNDAAFGDFNGPLLGNEREPGCQSQRQAIEDTCDAADARKALAEPGERVSAEELHREALAEPGDRVDYEEFRKELDLEEPAVLARLEAWLAEGHSRSCRFDLRDGTGLTATLNQSDGNYCFGVEWADCKWTEESNRVAIAKKPGLAATIEAALEKAEEVNL